MNKAIVFLLVLLISCNSHKTLPPSTGGLFEVLFVVDDNIWEINLRERVYDIFAANLDGINKAEQQYDIIQVNYSELNGFLKRHNNIVLITNEDNDRVGNKNMWAKPQLCFQIQYDEKENRNLHKIKKILDFNVLTRLRTQESKSSNHEIEEYLLNTFQTQIVISKKYQILKKDSSLFWATFNPQDKEQIEHVLIFKSNKILRDKQLLLEKTDSVFSKYLLGAKEGTYVKIEPLYTPFCSDDICRGIWRLQNGFMGGPFLLKSYHIKSNTIIAVGLIFDPSSKKRDYVKKFEAIL